MRILLTSGLRLVAACLVLYAVLIAVALLAFPPPGRGVAFDTATAPSTVFETEAKYLVLNRHVLGTPGTRVVLLGASNTVGGFPVKLTQAALPGASVVSAAVSGSNVTQIHEAFELTRSAIGPADRARTVYVIGLWYGVFVGDATHWTHAAGQPVQTAVDTELYRYDFYRREPHGPMPVVPERLLPAATVAIYPVIALEKLVRVVTEPVRSAFLGAQPGRTDSERNAYVASASDKRDQTAYWLASFPDNRIDMSQFAALEALVNEARADRSPVVVVNLPIPAWHSAAVRYDADYLKQVDAFIARHADDPLFASVDMRDMNNDTWFSDEVHPKPRVVPLWVRRIAAPVGNFVARVDARAEAPVDARADVRGDVRGDAGADMPAAQKGPQS
ncbi:hypothetical protein [Paraburkholderia bannensis]|uniref:hypothetical protein n=1 Tax=Paraburkholderia bannensis TaxID=765414 RepID=UPI002ABE8FD3|nr:hypothetical protein [Paraburkholderia bannensis]